MVQHAVPVLQPPWDHTAPWRPTPRSLRRPPRLPAYSSGKCPPWTPPAPAVQHGEVRGQEGERGGESRGWAIFLPRVGTTSSFSTFSASDTHTPSQTDTHRHRPTPYLGVFHDAFDAVEVGEVADRLVWAVQQPSHGLRTEREVKGLLIMHQRYLKGPYQCFKLVKKWRFNYYYYYYLSVLYCCDIRNLINKSKASQVIYFNLAWYKNRNPIFKTLCNGHSLKKSIRK